MEQTESKPEQMLMEALDFTPQDLRLNREGVISERQRMLLNQIEYPSKLTLTAIIFTFILLGAFIVFIQVWFSYGTPPLETIRVFSDEIARTTLAGGGCGGIIGVWLALQSLMMRRNIERGEVSKVRGKAKLRTAKYKGEVLYDLIIGRTTFRVAEKAYISLSEGQAYDVYYIKNRMGNIMLLVESAREEGFWT